MLPDAMFVTLVDAIRSIRKMRAHDAAEDRRTLCGAGRGTPFLASGPAALLDVSRGAERRLGLSECLDVPTARHVIDAALARDARASAEQLCGAINYYVENDAFPDSLSEVAEFWKAPAELVVNGACTCDAYGTRSELEQKWLAGQLEATLTRVASHEELRVTLCTCPACGRVWQNRMDGDLFFEVPRISAEDWRQEPYADIVEWRRYQTALAAEVAAAIPRDVPCKSAGCDRSAVVHSVFCLEHHRQTYGGRRPERPAGRALA